MIYFDVRLRNGFGFDLSLLPKESDLMINDEGNVIELTQQLFQLLVPLVALFIGSYDVRELSKEESKHVKESINGTGRD